ncbi:patatin-like phospholipase family protein [Amnibacterium sp. CER49]|uniref:patatin-like phospholipase family protein n=1 Tax=Amnibacterium sp. CER49 TaxID=3039161 RepID=UPI00244D59C2|nr:patatin-like phospholipase family protein [Amnibacterium sp. CER49]MDH2444819.1 patatin-like phospholipase family protein [Amnibacterium sp. CER49]
MSAAPDFFPLPEPRSLPPFDRGRALVLGGAGAVGNAWEIGLVAGLLEGGLDVTDADLVVGTSGGATAAIQLTSGRSPRDLLADILDTATPRPTPPPAAPAGPAVDHLARTGAIIATASDPADMRRRMGAAAIGLDPDGSASARWRSIVAARLTGLDWPQRAVLIPAVDARTGDPVVLHCGSGVQLVDAVAASTSSGAAYRVGERRFLDGGYRRNENADLAAGVARVLVLSPFGGRTRHPEEWGMQLTAQVEGLRKGGSRVETVFPADDAAHLFGPDAGNVALRPAAARSGRSQGRSLAERLGPFWR